MKPIAQPHDINLDYMNRWFVKKHHLASLCGIEEAHLDTLLKAQCAPGIIYSYHDNHGWWSALAAAMGDAEASPPAGGQDWYTPGARWWLRRAMLTMRNGCNTTQAALENKHYFLAQFQEQCKAIPYAHYLFEGDSEDVRILSTEAINQTAMAEWQSWINGAFGVCLIHFSAQTCIRKGALGHWIKTVLNDQTTTTKILRDVQIFNLVEELAPLMTPFSPWERPSGTPGQVIDRALEKLGLGTEFPYGLFAQ